MSLKHRRHQMFSPHTCQNRLGNELYHHGPPCHAPCQRYGLQIHGHRRLQNLQDRYPEKMHNSHHPGYQSPLKFRLESEDRITAAFHTKLYKMMFRHQFEDHKR